MPAAPAWPPAWAITRAEFVTETAGSVIWRVERRADPAGAIVKALKDNDDVADELRGAHYLRWRAGEGAVRLMGEHGHWLLLEDGGTRTLETEPDESAMRIAADLLRRLNAPSAHAVPTELQPLGERFAALFGHCAAPRPCDAGYRIAATLAHDLLSAPQHVVPLHGDLHHGNVVQGARGWRAIDAKGVLGDAAFDAANWFYNPWGQDALHRSPARIAALANTLARALGCTPRHVLRHAAAYGGLSAAWFAQDGDAANERRTLTTLSILHAALAAQGD